jgi:hypothetical protein
MTRALFALLAATPALANPTVAVYGLDAVIDVDLDRNEITVSGDLIDSTCKRKGLPANCDPGDRVFAVLTDRGEPILGVFGMVIDADHGSLVFDLDGASGIFEEGAAARSEQYGIWGTNGTSLELAGVWGTDGTAIWGTGGVAIWGTDGTSIVKSDTPFGGELVGVWGTDGTAIWGGNNGTRDELVGVWGTDGTAIWGTNGTSIHAELPSTDPEVLYAKGVADLIGGVSVKPLAIERLDMKSACVAFTCK